MTQRKVTTILLYLYNGVLVGNALAVKETAQASPVSTLAQAFVAAFGQDRKSVV